MKYFVNPFVDIALTCFHSLFHSFLFDVILFSLLFFTKTAISLLLVEFACLSLAVNFLMLTSQKC